jgi:hypothetical protein
VDITKPSSCTFFQKRLYTTTLTSCQLARFFRTSWRLLDSYFTIFASLQLEVSSPGYASDRTKIWTREIRCVDFPHGATREEYLLRTIHFQAACRLVEQRGRTNACERATLFTRFCSSKIESPCTTCHWYAVPPRAPGHHSCTFFSSRSDSNLLWKTVLRFSIECTFAVN